jgi:GT2 family glycosyltransferase
MSAPLAERATATPAAHEASFVPVQLVEVEAETPLPERLLPLPGHDCGRALILVRLHDHPVGSLELELPPQGVDAQELAGAVWRECGEALRSHLEADGLDVPDGLEPGGIRHEEPGAPCQRERDAFLKDAPPISVLIPTRERPERLRRCVQSILDSRYPTERIRVVIADNAPTTSATRELASELRASSAAEVVYVREDAPGSASARNRGLTQVETEVVAMTDDDVIVDPHWLTEVARAFASHPQAGAVSGLLWPAELETEAQLWFEQYGGFSRGFERRVFDLHEHRPPDEPLYPWNAGLFGTGNNFSFRTQALRDIGGFDPALGNGTPALGGVDSEVLLRTILSGYQIIYEPAAVAHHAHRADYDGLRKQVYAYGVGLVAYYLKTVLAEPRFALDFARKLPAGIRWMLSPDSHINKHKQDDYPPELQWIERRGMLYGPLAYARSRRRYGRHRVYGRRRSA